MIIPLFGKDISKSKDYIYQHGVVTSKFCDDLESLFRSCRGVANVDMWTGSDLEETVLIDYLERGIDSLFIPFKFLTKLKDCSQILSENRLCTRIKIVLDFEEVVRIGEVSDEAKEFQNLAKRFGQNGVLVDLSTTTPEPDIKAVINAVQQLKSVHKACNVVLHCSSDWESNDDNSNKETAVALHVAGVDLLVEESSLTDDLYGTVLFNCLGKDRPDGLVPTVVVNAQLQCLGLVYSSQESVLESLRTRRGVYQSRKRGLWYKGESSGSHQDLLKILVDCDADTLCFVVKQHGTGFCHKGSWGCFSEATGLTKLSRTLESRLHNAPPNSYTSRLFNNGELLNAKILEEAKELTEADTKVETANEAADLLYFSLAKCIRDGVSLEDIEQVLDSRSKKVGRRAGHAKVPLSSDIPAVLSETEAYSLKVYNHDDLEPGQLSMLQKRPLVSNDSKIKRIVEPIIKSVKEKGDEAVIALTKKFDKAILSSPVLILEEIPTPELTHDLRKSIDLAYENILKFHEKQLDLEMLVVETSNGVHCSRVTRAIEKVGLYIPGGTAILFSTALMLGVPAMIAQCKEIIIATPPRPDGSVSIEILYVAKKIGASKILLAGGAQAIAALAYGTQSVPKVDKIFGPGNEFVTVAKMLVQQDSSSPVAVDMPAGPTELMVLADGSSNPRYVAADLLSQAEHGPQSQVVLILQSSPEKHLHDILREIKVQASQLPRCGIIEKSLSNSFVLLSNKLHDSITFANGYAPEHLIISTENAKSILPYIQNAGSVFLGRYSTESCGDYAAGCNHTLPTYGYARMYSGVTVQSFQKYLFALEMDEVGLKAIGPAVEIMAEKEGLLAHKNAVTVRLNDL